MFLARVLTGDYCKGNSSLKAPPVKDTRNNRLYDSVVDDVTNPSIFVVFKDSSVYPSYLITFIWTSEFFIFVRFIATYDVDFTFLS